jgi:hypothetical protein
MGRPEGENLGREESNFEAKSAAEEKNKTNGRERQRRQRAQIEVETAQIVRQILECIQKENEGKTKKQAKGLCPLDSRSHCRGARGESSRFAPEEELLRREINRRKKRAVESGIWINSNRNIRICGEDNVESAL